MNKFLICALALFAVALAAPQHPEYQHLQQAEVAPHAHVLKHDSEVSPDGYHFEFETSDGTARQEQGSLKQVSDEHQALTVAGSYRYVAPDGLVYTVTYTADENGFQPQQHLEHAGQQ